MKKLISVIALLIVFMPLRHAAAAEADAANIEKIDQAWGEVVKEANDLLARNLAVVADGDATERYNAYKNVIAMIMDMYTDTLYRSSSRDQPEYLPYSTLITNSCAPSMSTRYGVAYIEPGASYRIWGTRGNPVDIDIQQWTSYGGTPDGYPVSATGEFASKTFGAEGIKTDKNGGFEFIIGPTKPAKGQWWKLEDNVRVLMFRDVYNDYSKEAIPPVYHLEKIGPKDKGPTTLSTDEAVERLHIFATAMKSMDICFKRRGNIPPLHSFIQKVFASNPDDESAATGPAKDHLYHQSGQQKDQIYYMAEFNIKAGQALVAEWTPPASYLYWNVQLVTRTGQNFNFGARQVNLTDKMVHVDKDGKVRFVISHEDPHIANWLDLDGNDRGHVWIRIKKGPVVDPPAAKLVNIDQVMENLPNETAMVTDEERQRQLDLRRRLYQTWYSH